MNGVRQAWLVAPRELRERGRSRAFIASLVVMVVAVVRSDRAPSPGRHRAGHEGRRSRLALSHPRCRMSSKPEQRGRHQPRSHRYHTLAAGEQLSARTTSTFSSSTRSNWSGSERADKQLEGDCHRRHPDRRRARPCDCRGESTPEDLAALDGASLREERRTGRVAGRSPDDETAAYIMTALLFMSIATDGAMVLNGVVEEKSSRVVEVLLARIRREPARRQDRRHRAARARADRRTALAARRGDA